MKNLPAKRGRLKAPAEKRGVSEQFRDNDNFAGNHVPLNRSSVEGVVMDERRDASRHPSGCEPGHLAVTKRVAQRFHELGLLSHGNGTPTAACNNNNNNNNQNYEDQEEEDYDDEDEDDDSRMMISKTTRRRRRRRIGRKRR